MIDENGEVIKEGDEITFSYGIPPVYVRAKIAKINNKLYALTPEHNPKKCLLSSLRRHVGLFYKVTKKPKSKKIWLR